MNPRNIENLSAAAPAIATIEVKGGDAVRQWVELKQTYEAMRGTRPAANKKTVPKTRVRDVKQIAARWSEEMKKVSPRNDLDRAEHDRWKACLDRVASLSSSLGPDAEYPENEKFWQHCAKRVSIYLESRKVVPSRWRLFTDSVTEALEELPEVLGSATKSAASAAAGLFGNPAKLAAVLLGGAILVPPIIRAIRK